MDGTEQPGRPPAADAAPAAEAGPATAVETRRSRMERIKAERTRAEAWVGQTRRRLEDARPGNTAIDSVFRAVERDANLGGNVLSGAVAFRVFMLMVPYVFVVVVGLGAAADSVDQNPKDVARNAGVGGLAAQAVSSAAHDLSPWQQIVSLVVGAFALLLAARALVKVLRTVHALAWQMPMPRSRNTTRAAVGLIGVVTAFEGIAILINGVRDRSSIVGLLLLVASVALVGALWLWVSVKLPHAAPDWRALVPGAVVFAAGVEALHVVTVYWISYQVSSKSETYGAIGIALALLLWSYLLGRVVTVAAITNAALWHRAHAPAPRGPAPPDRAAEAPAATPGPAPRAAQLPPHPGPPTRSP